METKPEMNVVNETLSVLIKNILIIEEDEPINIMDIIETDDRNLMENNRIANMARIWGTGHSHTAFKWRFFVYFREC